MTRQTAGAADAVPDYSWSIPVSGDKWIDMRDGDLPCDVSIRLGQGKSGRIFITGLRVGMPDAVEPYEVTTKHLRELRLGNILRAIREAVLSNDPLWTKSREPYGKSIAEDILGSADFTKLSVPRGPKGDPEVTRRTAECYEAALRRGLSKTEAVVAVSRELFVSESQVYRRLAKARRKGKA